MRCIDVVEGKDFSLDRVNAERLREAVDRLQVKLKPRLPLLSESGGKFQLFNVVGTVDLGGGTVIQVSPKIEAGSEWVTAVVSLLTGREGIDVAGERRAGFSTNHSRLLEAVAQTYLRRLECAFRQEGPIVLLERRATELPYLQGKLDTTRWARTALWRPHIFPVVRTEFAQDNPFTRGLVLVSDSLAQVSPDPRTRAGLHALSRDLSVGLPRNAPPPNGIAARSLPEQWSAYKPAWSLAMAILSRTSLFGPTGSLSGVGLAIEPWPLLETLLERSLQAMERVGKAAGRTLSYQMQGEVALLRPRGSSPQERFAPRPDGRLLESGKVLASFEAKYSSYDGKSPKRDHVYQAVATAAACDAPIAVLVYPDTFEPQVWDVSGFSGRPAILVAVGLGLFQWHSSRDSEARAEQLLSYLDGLSAQAPAAPLAVVA